MKRADLLALVAILTASAWLAKPRPPTPPPPLTTATTIVRREIGKKAAHFIGVYESTLSHHGINLDGTHYNDSPSPINVTVKAGGPPATLILSSYEPIVWHVTLEKGASLRRILLSDYPDENMTSSVAGAPVEVERVDLPHAIHQLSGPDDKPAEIEQTLEVARAASGCRTLRFQGEYSGSNFSVGP